MPHRRAVLQWIGLGGLGLVPLSEALAQPAAGGSVALRRGDWQALCQTVFGEARGESTLGQRAVCAVILNRVPAFAPTVRAVCHQPGQFSVWSPGNPNRAAMLAADERNPDYLRVMLACLGLILGEHGDPTQGATFYHTVGVRPRWARALRFTVQIGRHRFYR